MLVVSYGYLFFFCILFIYLIFFDRYNTRTYRSIRKKYKFCNNYLTNYKEKKTTTTTTTTKNYTTLHCIAMHCTALHCTALHCTALHYTALHCTTLHYTTLHCTALHCTALHCTALHCTALHYTTLHYKGYITYSTSTKTVHSPLFFLEIVDVDRSVRPGRHLGLFDANETGERT